MIPIGPNFLASDVTMPEKKSQKTTRRDLELAAARLRQIKRGSE